MTVNPHSVLTVCADKKAKFTDHDRIFRFEKDSVNDSQAGESDDSSVEEILPDQAMKEEDENPIAILKTEPVAENV